jgi:hypothetical protein
MSVQTPSEGTGAARYREPASIYARPEGEGWMTFAGIMLMILGVVNVIGGIAAIDDANFYIGNAEFQIGDLNTWGWVVMLTGIAQVLTAFGIWARNQFARWLGVGFAAINMFAQLLMIAAFPLWSLAIFSVDLLIIYGLVLYGQRADRTA